MLTVKIWDVNPSKSEVIGHCDGNKKINDRAEPTKSNAKKEDIFKFSQITPLDDTLRQSGHNVSYF